MKVLFRRHPLYMELMVRGSQIDEQPVAFAIIILSPKSWVMVLMYAVSPQPAHAPENSRYGLQN